MRQTVPFDPAKQYMDFMTVEDLTPVTENAARKELQRGIDSFIPSEFQERIKWVINYWPAATIRVKDDNYEMLGLTRADIGKVREVKAHWTIAWKLGPVRKAQLGKFCDGL